MQQLIIPLLYKTMNLFAHTIELVKKKNSSKKQQLHVKSFYVFYVLFIIWVFLEMFCFGLKEKENGWKNLATSL